MGEIRFASIFLVLEKEAASKSDEGSSSFEEQGKEKAAEGTISTPPKIRRQGGKVGPHSSRGGSGPKDTDRCRGKNGWSGMTLRKKEAIKNESLQRSYLVLDVNRFEVISKKRRKLLNC